jgi:hypothetical protein
MIKTLASRPFLLFFLLFLVVSGLFIFLNNLSPAISFDLVVVLSGNFILLAATLISFLFYRKSLQNNRGQYIVRMMYSALLAKMFICLIAITAYIMVKRSGVDKLAIMLCLGLYLIYTFVELSVLMQLSKAQKNVKAGSTP